PRSGLCITLWGEPLSHAEQLPLTALKNSRTVSTEGALKPMNSRLFRTAEILLLYSFLLRPVIDPQWMWIKRGAPVLKPLPSALPWLRPLADASTFLGAGMRPLQRSPFGALPSIGHPTTPRSG